MHLKINRVLVKQLFGFLNYELQFPESEQLILTGPNGYGKTMLLKLIHHAISDNYTELCKINFKSFDLYTNHGHVRYFKNGSVLKVESFLYNSKRIVTYTPQHNVNDKVFDREVVRSILINSVRLNNESESDNIITKQRHLLADKMKSAKKLIQLLDGLVIDLFSNIHKSNDNGIYEFLPEMISERIVGLQKKLRPYAELGLLDNSSELINASTSQLYCLPNSTQVLSDKLAEIFYEISLHEDFIGRVMMFFSLITRKKFAFKTLYITPDVGFAFSNHNNTNIPLELLSSGEKNQISIFFDLIFKAENGTLILIDEPEISLHISWQKNLLKEFSEIAKFNHYAQLIIATHSPDVINDEWDISVDLYDMHKIDTGNK
ncbi:AAA family ATPase [Aliivibrio fischeri]|uniref:AAA family ATPase n=1 Tax=Aliivibrio fischeri TaxID=668 RepID=UPI0012D8634C|nr:AAA family ATPase [Aliivibrio fischeri]MUJ20441.1 AAA family ATPase [Aliivibrio fischeri]